MKPVKKILRNWMNRLIQRKTLALFLGLILVFGSVISWDSPAYAANRKSSLAQGNAILDPLAILRYALPFENENVRQLQGDIECGSFLG